MEAAPQPSTPWSTTQAYMIAVCCLLLGAIAGYALRSTGPASVSVPQQAQQPQQPAHPGAPAMNQPPTPQQMKHMADKAAEPLLAKLQANPNDAELLAQVGGTYYVARQFDTAATYYKRAAVAKPSAKAFVSLGNALYYGGDADGALAAFDRALALEPGSADALFNIGMLKWEAQNNPKAAVEAWQQLLKANPHHPRRAQVEEMIARAKQHMSAANVSAK
jgi:cytochrome c-type biogenesis protein CcmH/NrfG